MKRLKLRLMVCYVGLLTSSLLMAGCGESEPSNDSIRISDEWVEASVRGRDYTPAYVTIRSREPDVLVDANVSGDVAEHTLLYRTHDGGDPSKYTSFNPQTNDDGRLFARWDREFKPLSEWERNEGYLVPRPVNGGPRADHVSEIPIDSNDPKVTGGIVPMHYFGYFILLTGLPKPLEPGTPVDLELEFEKAGKIDVPTKVRESRPGLNGFDSETAAVRTSRLISLPPTNASISMVSGDLVAGDVGNLKTDSRFILKFGNGKPSAATLFWSTSRAAFYKPSDIAKGTVDGIQYAFYFGDDAHSNKRYRLVHSVINRACRVAHGRDCDWVGVGMER